MANVKRERVWFIHKLLLLRHTAKQERQSITQASTAARGWAQCVSQKQPSLQLRLSVCILTICMFTLRTISNSCNLHQWCPSRAQAYESDVLAAEQESSVPLEGALIYVMGLKLITPEPQSSIQEETVSLVLLWFLCPATVCKKWSCLLSRSWLRIPPNKDSVKQCVSVSLPEVTGCLCVRFSLKRGLTRLKLKLFVALLLRLFWLGVFFSLPNYCNYFQPITFNKTFISSVFAH